ncbi:hypothetical protein EZV73_05855 [Acidaminobacter sp. JC074]|uniref:hypothetical protein n=1 Tax=Acidaminobacter sp. JC074 TaxID=2530199 RepID=UPI001F1153EB|nr:hypothetical protein [Acidaminobacter sp. JC074]MCH4887083.1 hypothetical protein [Acidaminobacter sp. JC074]
MWFIISIVLVLWVLYDLIKGEVWSYYKIYRSSEPGKYWFYMLIWSLIAGASLYMSIGSYY